MQIAGKVPYEENTVSPNPVKLPHKANCISEEHRNRAVTGVSEHPRFTAANSLQFSSRNIIRLNDVSRLFCPHRRIKRKNLRKEDNEGSFEVVCVSFLCVMVI